MENTTPHQQNNSSGKKDLLRRLYFATAILLITSITVLFKLFDIQLVDRDQYRSLAKRQYERKIVVEAERGAIFDRNMNLLAVNLIYYSFGADPTEVENPDAIAGNFAKVFGKSKRYYLNRLQQTNSFVWLERKVAPRKAAKIQERKGLIKLQDLKRHYPYGKLAAQVLGFTDIDNRGVSGIEQTYDSLLAGKDGWAILQADAKNRLSPDSEYPSSEPEFGRNLVLSLDIIFQSIVEEELQATVDKYKAADGIAIIMSPNTGEVLAMANAPGFDPNRYSEYDKKSYRNRAITDIYEPGSTFKVLTAVAAIEEKIVKSTDLVFCENGVFRIHDIPIRDSHKHGYLSFSEVVEQSSNIGIIKTALKLGSDRYYQFARSVGIGNKTGIDLSGEVSGDLKNPVDWSGLSLPMISMGQEVSITAMQLANVYATIANGGTLYRPFMLKQVTDPEGVVLQNTEPNVIRKVSSQSTMLTVKDMLAHTVQKGTGKKANIDWLDVAGKTGTAQKFEMANQRYSKEHFVASFVGFFPVYNPQLVCLVIVNDPKGVIWGADVAAPTVRRIAERIVGTGSQFNQDLNRLLAVHEDSSALKVQFVPDLKFLPVSLAEKIAEESSLPFQFVGTGGFVRDQSIPQGNKIGDGEKLLLYLSEDTNRPDQKSNGKIRTPDVRGLSVRTALNKLLSEKLDVQVIGSGLVVSQYPKAGSYMNEGDKCVLECAVSR